MSLRERLIAGIVRDGPISVADYMTACLHDPEDGYYAVRPDLGEAGDFITAPLVSQMFGELLGLWAAAVWEQMGAPSRLRLIELGPGDGTLMSDVLRAAAAAPGFRGACEVWLVESSGPLRDRQAARLAGADIHWAAELVEVPADAPVIIIANEFLDCLPISQMAFVEGQWVERRVWVDGAGELVFFPSPSGEGRDGAERSTGWGQPEPRQILQAPGSHPTPVASRLDPPHRGEGGFLIHEHSIALTDFARQVARLIARAGGAALFIDYGRDEPGYGDTLQALRRHEKEHPLSNPGEADLTAHVDFPAFAAAAEAQGGATGPIRRQGEFLRSLGVETRAAELARARPDRADVIARQLERLIGPDHMGILFKAVCLHSPGLAPPGFEP